MRAFRKVSRRVRLAWFTVAVLAFLVAGVAQASAPMVRTQAPGFYRMMLGHFEVTALSDGTSPAAVAKILRHVAPGEVARALAQHALPSRVPTSVNAYLINTGQRLVLIDTGVGAAGEPEVGHLLANLRAAGYRPGQIDEILITHMHPDHIGGLTHDGAAVFPRAVVRASRREADYWLKAGMRAGVSAKLRARSEHVRAVLKPYIAAHRFVTFKGAAQITPGIRAVPLPGHTPGHTGYMISSDGQQLLVWGDIVHVAAVQFADPSVTVTYDSNPVEAAKQRKRIFADAAARGYLVAGAHIAFPGIGHVRKQGKGYVWIPVDYVATPGQH